MILITYVYIHMVSETLGTIFVSDISIQGAASLISSLFFLFIEPKTLRFCAAGYGRRTEKYNKRRLPLSPFLKERTIVYVGGTWRSIRDPVRDQLELIISLCRETLVALASKLPHIISCLSLAPVKQKSIMEILQCV